MPARRGSRSLLNGPGSPTWPQMVWAAPRWRSTAAAGRWGACSTPPMACCPLQQRHDAHRLRLHRSAQRCFHRPRLLLLPLLRPGRRPVHQRRQRAPGRRLRPARPLAYAYVEGNPVDRVDPSGHVVQCVDTCNLDPLPPAPPSSAQIQGFRLADLGGISTGVLLQGIVGKLRGKDGPYGGRAAQWRTLNLVAWENPNGERSFLVFQSGDVDYPSLLKGSQEILGDVRPVTGYAVPRSPGMPSNLNDAEMKMLRFQEKNGGRLIGFEATNQVCADCRVALQRRLGVLPSQVGRYGWSNPAVGPLRWEAMMRRSGIGASLTDEEGNLASRFTQLELFAEDP